MDDMKKLVEKYKRELMEYSRAAKPEKLSFPEMLPEDEPAAEPPQETLPPPEPQTAETAPEEPPRSFVYTPEDEPETERKPRIVGYSEDSSAFSSLEKYLAELNSSSDGQNDDMDYTGMDEPTAAEQSFNELPPQFTDEAPQNDFTGNAVIPETNFDTDVTEPEQPNPFPRTGEVNTAEPGQVENIGNIPESGQSPDEQLGRRSFESRQSPRNDPADIKPLEQQVNDDFPEYPPEPKYDSYEEFIKANSRLGSLSFRTFTARNALPVPNANIVVFKEIGGQRHVFYTLTTDSSGKTAEVNIPAPPSSLSQSPVSAVQPYSLYNADITADGFDPVSIRNLPIFEGIISVQRVVMVPTAGVPESETITEEEPPLTEVQNA